VVSTGTSLTGVGLTHILTHMIKTQVYFPEHDLEALHRAAKKAGKSVAEMIREAVRRTWLRHSPEGPVALWDGKARPGIDHDSIYDEP
jgi:hypothetical protein